MNRSKRILALLAGGLACACCSMAQSGGGTTPNPTTVTYDSSRPDYPFVGAWEGDQPDCSDPDTETDCWKCEASSGKGSAFPVPKYWYEVEIKCPTLQIKGGTHNECVCVLEGTKNAVKVQATLDKADGYWRYVPKGETGCGKTGTENLIKFKEPRWAWKTVGRPGGDIMETGDLASFDYVVPSGKHNITVIFQARGIPDYGQCGPVTTAEAIVGEITGTGYSMYKILPVMRDYPREKYVSGMVEGEAEKEGFGRVIYRIFGAKFECVEVCSGTDFKMYRLEGSFGIVIEDMEVSSCIDVTADGCNMSKGSCRPRNSFDIKRTVAHEKKHLDLWWDFIDKWNSEIMQLGFFSSCEYAEMEGEKLIERFNEAYAILKKQQKDHCPHFAGDLLFSINGCGSEFPYGGDRICP